ncbi:hypothetical protein [Robiginitalea aurantiaca]|uniref:Uncharacterized protein n=1 Tax=Robiginitalea aurantiaca TaxID=3056915 RepID=A0ABT7WGH0_9FLAO|nr:hypothetical protein [Robiginitalea aurantiaca]MDM9631914.1 hypothetical protein [Robiginitalea aurantiaca]
MFERTNIELKLDAERGAVPDRTALENLLKGVEIELPSYTEAPGKKVRPASVNQFDFDSLDTSRIYHLDHIRNICIDYRLRFLDLKYFKPELPQEAREAIAEIEEVHQTELQGLKIIAPSRLFKLADKDDPLLFVPMGNQYFYLVHKWGNDLHPLRKLLVWPFKSMVNLILLIVLASYLLTLVVPEGLFSKNGSQTEFWIIFFFVLKSVMAIAIYFGIAKGKNFNPAIWNSKYFNA